MKKTISLLLVVVLLASSFTAFARASDYISSYNVGVSLLGNGKVRVSAIVIGTNTKLTRIGFPDITLYEKVGNKITIVASVSADYNYNAGTHGCQFDYQGVAGRTYYAAASFSAMDSTGGDSRSATSISVVAN